MTIISAIGYAHHTRSKSLNVDKKYAIGTSKIICLKNDWIIEYIPCPNDWNTVPKEIEIAAGTKHKQMMWKALVVIEYNDSFIVKKDKTKSVLNLNNKVPTNKIATLVNKYNFSVAKYRSLLYAP